MKPTTILIFLSLFLAVSCQPSQQAIQTAMAQTQAALPTATAQPTATLVPFSEFDLENLVIQDNDLPVGYSGAQVSNTLPKMFNDVPKPDYSIYQQLARNGAQEGGISVLLYEDQQKIDSAYKTIFSGELNTKSVTGDWDKAEIMNISMTTPIVFNAIDMLLTKCHAVVHIRITGIKDNDNVIAYAERLTKRLTPLVCR